GRPAARAGPACVRLRPRDHGGRRRARIRRRKRLPARLRARSFFRALRVDQFVYRNGAAIPGSRRDQSMGAAMGRETDTVKADTIRANTVAFLASLEATPYRYDFYQTLRRLECLYADKPRWGRALRPVDEPIRLGQ